MRRSRPWLLLPALVAVLGGLAVADEPGGPPARGPGGAPGGGLPPAVRARQSDAAVEVPALEAGIRRALDAADEEAAERIDRAWHTGRRLRVPSAYPTIQAGIDAAEPRDVVVVAPGTYYELLVMKDGVKLVSEGDDERVEVEGARLRLPRRALVTIVDGSKAEPSKHGLVDFVPGTGPHAIVDGFTLRHLPRQDHHIPGHAHAVNLRGAGAVILNCLVEGNGSTGIGSHVVYRDQARPIPERDFRAQNVAHEARGVIFRNIVRGNLGRGIGCNHLSAPWILGNEVYGNDDAELGEEPGPGIGAKHGASPTIVGNVVHDNPHGGIMSRVGEPQGAFQIDRPATPTVRCNVVYANGADRPGISNAGGGSEASPVVIADNVLYDSGISAIGVSAKATAVIEGNRIRGGRLAGIAVNDATVVRLDDNAVTATRGAGVTIVGGAHVLEMKGNAVSETAGPAYVVVGSTVR